MKKILIAILAACCVWAAYDYSRPVDRYVVKVTAAEGDTLWHLVGGVMDSEGTGATSVRLSSGHAKLAI